jgi:hypothetical protein
MRSGRVSRPWKRTKQRVAKPNEHTNTLEMLGFAGFYPTYPKRFVRQSANCQLDIPDACGWDWLAPALGNPTTRAEYSATFDLEFRGKIVERGQFGHKGMCAYRIEVIEMLSVKQLT